MQQTTHKCNKCEIEYPHNEQYFYKCKRVKSGLTVTCKKCYNLLNTEQENKRNAAKLAMQVTTFSQEKEKYADKVIDYSDSLTGKAYIGLAKKPLMRNDNGIGYKGVLMQSDNRALVQCYECGEWFNAIRGTHLKLKHNMTIWEYKKKYGFSYKFSLDSDVTTQRVMQAVDRDLVVRVATLNKHRHKTPKPPITHVTLDKKPMSTLNNEGNCPDQLKDKMIHFIHSFKKLPARHVKDNHILTVYPYINRFGSLNNTFKFYGLPTREIRGYAAVYTFADGEVFNYDRRYNVVDDLYKKLLEKCPILTINL